MKFTTYGCPNNLVFISGVHGTGKTTLMMEILKSMPELLLYEKCEITSFEDCFERQIRRIAKYRIDYNRIRQMCRQNPDKIIITDRCFYDAMIYLMTFRQLGKLDNEQYRECNDALRALFPHANMRPRNIIWLHPSVKEVFAQINKRKSDTGKFKWNEFDTGYTMDCYHTYDERFCKFSSNILKLTSSNLSDNVQESIKFINSIKK